MSKETEEKLIGLICELSEDIMCNIRRCEKSVFSPD